MSFQNNKLRLFIKIYKFRLSVITILLMLLLIIFSPDLRAEDTYQSMTDLMDNTNEGTDWELSYNDNNSDTLIGAIHGGNIEAGTSEAAKLTANKGAYRYYAFEGIRPSDNSDLHVTSTNFSDNSDLHVTSTNFDEPIIESMQQKVSSSVMIHGADGNDATIYIGGKDETLKDSIENELTENGFNVEVSPSHLEGESSQNIANKNAENAGVQLELTTGLRQSFFNNQDLSFNSRSDQSNWSMSLYDFAQALKDTIEAK